MTEFQEQTQNFQAPPAPLLTSRYIGLSIGWTKTISPTPICGTFTTSAWIINSLAFHTLCSYLSSYCNNLREYFLFGLTILKVSDNGWLVLLSLVCGKAAQRPWSTVSQNCSPHDKDENEREQGPVGHMSPSMAISQRPGVSYWSPSPNESTASHRSGYHT